MKVKLTDDLFAKMLNAFEGKDGIPTGDGLTRTELRCLENHGYVEKIPFFERSKYVDGIAQKKYIWKRIIIHA